MLTPEEFNKAVVTWTSGKAHELNFAAHLYRGFEGWIQVSIALDTMNEGPILREWGYFNSVDVGRARRYYADFALPVLTDRGDDCIALWEFKAFSQKQHSVNAMARALNNDFEKYSLTQNKIVGQAGVSSGVVDVYQVLQKWLVIYYPTREKANLQTATNNLAQAYGLTLEATPAGAFGEISLLFLLVT